MIKFDEVLKVERAFTEFKSRGNCVETAIRQLEYVRGELAGTRALDNKSILRNLAIAAAEVCVLGETFEGESSD